MCVLIVSSSSLRILAEDWEAMVRTAGETAGVAWAEDKRVRFYRGLTPKQAYQLHCALAEEKRLHLVHLRLTTAGAHGAAMSQPFVLSGEQLFARKGYANRVFAHNGTVRAAFDWLPDNIRQEAFAEEWSDTAALAWLLRNTKQTLSVDCTSGYGNRFAFFTAKRVRLVGNWFAYRSRQKSKAKTVSTKERVCLISNLDWDFYQMKQWRRPARIKFSPNWETDQRWEFTPSSKQSAEKLHTTSAANMPLLAAGNGSSTTPHGSK